LERQHLQPSPHNAVGFRKEAMAADVDPVALVVHGAGNATMQALFSRTIGWIAVRVSNS
jgi:hypothetical protein